MRRPLSLVFTVIMALGLTSCQQEEINPEQVILALDSTEAKLVWLNHRLALEQWEYETKGSADSLQFYRGLRQHVLTDEKTSSLFTMGRTLITDEEDRRRLDMIGSLMMCAAVEAEPAIAALRDSLRWLRENSPLRLAGREMATWSVRDIMAGDDDRRRRGEAFTALCGPGEALAEGIERLVRLRNQQARRLGYNHYFALVFSCRGQRLTDYVGLLGRLEEATNGPYRDALSRIERRLGLNMLEVWDLEYATAEMQQRVDRYFPVDSQLAFVRRSLRAAGYDLDKSPVYFSITAYDDTPPGAAPFSIMPGSDHRVRANLVDGLGSTRLLMHSCGSTIHSLSVAQSREFFTVHMDPEWSRAMANTIAAFCDDPDWLEAQAHLPQGLTQEYVESLKDRQLVALRMQLTDLMFEYEAYQNANRDLNDVYWEMFERYMLLPRRDDSRPWAARAEFVDAPVTLQDELTADIITAQTIAYLRDQYGALFNGEDTRAFLEQNYFRFGSRYDWPELLERGTGESFDYRYLLAALGG